MNDATRATATRATATVQTKNQPKPARPAQPAPAQPDRVVSAVAFWWGRPSGRDCSAVGLHIVGNPGPLSRPQLGALEFQGDSDQMREIGDGVFSRAVDTR